MKRFFLLALFFVANCFAAHVAVLETIQTDGDLDRRECQFLTDKLRQMAVMTLPSAEGWTIMTRENISEMLPPGKSLEECEGSCLVETGKNISADYVVQGRVSHFGSLLTITVELYETATGKLVSSIAVKSENSVGLLEEIEKNAGPLFRAINNTPKEAQAAQETGAEKESAADNEVVAEKADDAGNAAVAENAGDAVVAENAESAVPADKMVLHSFNFVLPIEAEAEHGWGKYLGAEANWSRYMVESSGFSMVYGLSFGYVSGLNYVDDGYDESQESFEGMDLSFKYGWGYAPARDRLLLVFYGLVGAEVKYLFWETDDIVYAGDRIAFDATLGAEFVFGYRVGSRFWLMGGVEITTDVVGYDFYEVANSMFCFFSGVNIEPHVGIAIAF